MPRGLSPAQKTALSARLVRPASLVHLDIPGDPLRAWDGIGIITTLGFAHYGVGQFGSIEGISNERSLRSNNVNIALNGLPINVIQPHVLKKVRAIKYQGLPLRVYMGLLNPDTGVLTSDPWLMWVGVADVMSYQVGESVSLSLAGEHYSSHLRRINGLRMTHESHRQRTGLSTDIVFRFANRLTGRSAVIT